MRTIEEIYQALCSQFAQITGLTAAEGGDLSVRFYAVAADVAVSGTQLPVLGALSVTQAQ